MAGNNTAMLVITSVADNTVAIRTHRGAKVKQRVSIVLVEKMLSMIEIIGIGMQKMVLDVLAERFEVGLGLQTRSALNSLRRLDGRSPGMHGAPSL